MQQRWKTVLTSSPNFNLNTGMMLLLTAYFVVALKTICASGCGVEIVSRERWGAKLPRNVEFMNKTSVPHIFIHHTAMDPCNDFKSCSAMMRTIQDLHMITNGWNDIGYNFLIGGDGRAYLGRGWHLVGAHTYGFNTNAVAFSLMGNFVNNPPPSIMLNTTKMLIRCAQQGKYVTKDFKIHGHRDAGCTECPGQALYNIIKTWNRFQGGPLPGYSCRSGK